MRERSRNDLVLVRSETLGWARRGARGAEAEAEARRRRAQEGEEERRAERSEAAAMARRHGGIINDYLGDRGKAGLVSWRAACRFWTDPSGRVRCGVRWQVRRATSVRLAGHVLATGAGDPPRLPPLLRSPSPSRVSSAAGHRVLLLLPKPRGSRGKNTRLGTGNGYATVASHARPLLIPFFPVAVPRDGGAAFHLRLILAVRGGPRREIAY